MNDLIKREDAIKVTWQEPSYTDAINALTEARERIKVIPSAEHLIYEEMGKADIEAKAYAKGFKEGLEARKQGEWIEIEEDWRKQMLFWECSECGQPTSTAYNFCPNCGAKMVK